MYEDYFDHDYPYTDAHELNLDWIITKFKAILDKLDVLEAWKEVIAAWKEVIDSWKTEVDDLLEENYEEITEEIDGDDVTVAVKKIGKMVTITTYGKLPSQTGQKTIVGEDFVTKLPEWAVPSDITKYPNNAIAIKGTGFAINPLSEGTKIIYTEAGFNVTTINFSNKNIRYNMFKSTTLTAPTGENRIIYGSITYSV